jgi:hypothetical protein
MTGIDETNGSPANILCKSCGLCCTGHLFIWAKLRSAELDSAEALGLHVLRTPPSHRGFSQPCPLWQGQCTIYTSPHYPRFCRVYKCTLLKKVIDETTPLPEALSAVEEARRMISELEALLPGSTNPNFRERLAAYLEGSAGSAPDLRRQKANELLRVYEKVFGVKDVIDQLDEE